MKESKKIFLLLEKEFETNDEGYYPSDHDQGVPKLWFSSYEDAENYLITLVGNEARLNKFYYFLDGFFCSEYCDVKLKNFNQDFPDFALESEDSAFDFKGKPDKEIYEVLKYINMLPYTIKEVPYFEGEN
jgi:hypothetical protein